MIEDKYSDAVETIVATPGVDAGIVQGSLDGAIDEAVEMVVNAGGVDDFIKNGPVESTEEDNAAANLLENF